jgi:hypothetical protein
MIDQVVFDMIQEEAPFDSCADIGDPQPDETDGR